MVLFIFSVVINGEINSYCLLRHYLVMNIVEK